MIMFVVELIQFISRAFTLLIIARVLMTWVNPDPSNPIVRGITNLTEPVLAKVRNMLPSLGGFDFSPVVVMIGVQVLENLLIRFLLASVV